MFTEAELRDALRHSAARADTLPTADTPPADTLPVVGPGDVTPTYQGRRRARLLVPAAAAAVVAALAVASVLVARADRPTQQTGAAQESSAAVGSQPSAPEVVDLFQVGTTAVVGHEVHAAADPRIGAQTVRVPLGPINAMTLTIVPASAPYFDATRIPRDRPVPIASTTGYYSLLKLFPLDASTGAGSDKWLKHWTIAFQTPAGDWAFAYIEKAMSSDDPDPTDVSVDDPSMIAAEYDNLGVTFTPDSSRLPFRFGYLPAGLGFRSAMFETGVPEPGTVTMSLVDGAKSVDVQLFNAGFSGGSHCVSGCGQTVQREVGAHVIQLTARGYDAAEAQRMLDGIELAPDLDDRSTYFPLADVLG